MDDKVVFWQWHRRYLGGTFTGTNQTGFGKWEFISRLDQMVFVVLHEVPLSFLNDSMPLGF
jgi:hypothetical protein